MPEPSPILTVGQVALKYRVQPQLVLTWIRKFGLHAGKVYNNQRVAFYVTTQADVDHWRAKFGCFYYTGESRKEA